MKQPLPTSASLVALALAACGGRAPGPQAPAARGIALEPTVAVQQWYGSPQRCGQGPYELELPVAGVKWGEEFELRVSAPRAVTLYAQLLADDAVLDQGSAVYGGDPSGPRTPDNARCVADASEIRAATGGGRGGGGGPGGGAVGGGGGGGEVATPPATAPTVLEPHAGLVASSEVVIRIGWRDALGPDGLTPARVRFRFWSIEPNDLEGVWFGVSRIEWRPNVSEAEYEAHLEARAEEERRRQEAERLRLEAEWQRQQEAQRLEAERERQRLAQRTPEELERDRQRAKAQAEALERDRQRARARAEEEQRRRRAAEMEAEAERRRLAVEAALELERRQRREAYCAGHGEDRDCWGAGGLKVHLELQRYAETRARYCAEHPEDARCWDERERGRRASAWSGRRAEALRPPREPDGPPPAALAETPPPRLSPNAEWRPGYWHWTGFAWTWLAGMWRVPDSDLVAGLTTTAPQAPPPLRVEVAPPAPAAGAVWIAGFWQWSGKEWVWVAGSWQLRPAPGASWRGATWEVRGRVHVLIPGGWVEVRR